MSVVAAMVIIMCIRVCSYDSPLIYTGRTGDSLSIPTWSPDVSPVIPPSHNTHPHIAPQNILVIHSLPQKLSVLAKLKARQRKLYELIT